MHTTQQTHSLGSFVIAEKRMRDIPPASAAAVLGRPGGCGAQRPERAQWRGRWSGGYLFFALSLALVVIGWCSGVLHAVLVPHMCMVCPYGENKKSPSWVLTELRGCGVCLGRAGPVSHPHAAVFPFCFLRLDRTPTALRTSAAP